MKEIIISNGLYPIIAQAFGNTFSCSFCIPSTHILDS